MVDQRRVGVGVSVTSRAPAVPQIKIAQAVDVSSLFIGRSSIVLVQQLLGYLDVAVSMRRWLKNRCGLASLEATRGARHGNPGGVRSKKSKSPRLTARGSAPDRRRSFSQGPGQSRQAGAAIAAKGNRSERDLRHSVNTQAAYRAALRLASLPEDAMV